MLVGNCYEMHVRGKKLTHKEWKELYKKAQFKVKVNNQIIRTGVID